MTGHKTVDFYLNTCGCIPSFLCMFNLNQSAPALLPHASTLLFLAQNECTSVETGQLFHQCCRPSVVTAEVLERCKVQRGSVRCGPGWSLPRLFTHAAPEKEADTQPTGVTVPPPEPLSRHEDGAEIWIFALLFNGCFCGLLIYFATSYSYWQSRRLQYIIFTLMRTWNRWTLLIFVISECI